MKNLVIIIITLMCFQVKAQNVYKTPSGKKYHLASCRMVENVSKKLLGKADISKHHLNPCKICKPPKVENLSISYALLNKAVGESQSVRCKGITKKGTRCKHFTKIANGYCYQHTSQDTKKPTVKQLQSKSTTRLCKWEINKGHQQHQL